MKFFIDTADLNEIRRQDMGLLDGVTTNPISSRRLVADSKR